MTNPDYRAMCVELTDCLEKADWPHRYKDVFQQWVNISRAALAEPEAEGLTDDELWTMYDEMRGEPGAWAWVRNYARAVLARSGRPAAAPVPVSERLPGPEDCDEQGRCWLGGHQMGSGTPTWLLGYPAWAERFPDVHHFWLPANALPLPAPEGGEVQQ